MVLMKKKSKYSVGDLKYSIWIEHNHLQILKDI